MTNCCLPFFSKAGLVGLLKIDGPISGLPCSCDHAHLLAVALTSTWNDLDNAPSVWPTSLTTRH
jgi:hypothetical protein